MTIPEEEMLPLGNDVVLGDEDVAKGWEVGQRVAEKLNIYGMVSGSFWRCTNYRKTHGTPALEIRCYFSGKAKVSGLEDEVERDSEGKVVSQRQRNTFNERCGCKAMYRVSYKRIEPHNPNNLAKHWVGRWACEIDAGGHPKHQDHPNPYPPTRWLDQKRKIGEYQRVEALAKVLRYSRVPYKKARQQLKEQLGTDMLMSSKAFYNLASRKLGELKDDGTATALIAIFDNADWEYTQRTAEMEDGRKRLIQLTFWSKKYVHYARRFTSNSLLSVDCTFSTNNKGLPLMIAIGKSNTDKTFPVAFSYVPEEDAESYDEFFKTLREEIYYDIPDPSCVLADLGGGMTKAYDVHKCLPNSELQYCNWHAVRAMQKWYNDQGRYTTEQRERLRAMSWIYVQSNTVEELEINRNALSSMLDEQDRWYISKHWKQRENRLIACYTKFFCNLGAYSTQRSESYNKCVKICCDHQSTLRDSAQAIMDYVDDSFRDFEDNVELASARNLPGVPANTWSLLRGQITMEAQLMVKKQWNILMKGKNLDCSSQFRQQYLLPCSHDLRYTEEVGLAIPKSLVHPRYYLVGKIPTESRWQPTYEPVQALLAEAQPQAQVDLALEFERVLEARNLLPTYEQRTFDRLIRDTFERLVKVANSKLLVAELPMLLPDARPTTKKRIPDAMDRDIARLRREQKAKVQQERDDAILAQQLQGQDEALNINLEVNSDTQASIASHITVRPRSQIFDLSSSSSSSSSSDNELPDIPHGLPPASTAPPALQQANEVTARRKRAGTGFYKTLLGGDSQEIKRARQ
jgi:hypothetical protein